MLKGFLSAIEPDQMVRSSLWYSFGRSLPDDDIALPEEFIVDYGYAAPWLYDDPQGRFRKPTIQDQVDMIRLGNALPCVQAVNAPSIGSEFDPRVETIESARLLLLNTREPGYVEAKVPGLQAAFMKTYRQMAFGCTVSLPLPVGALDNGAAFSPTQAMIDLEINEAIYKFSRGIEVNANTCAVDVINELLFCERQTYLESAHTLAHFRQVGWNPRLFDRRYFGHAWPAPCGDETMLQQADQTWRQLVADQPAPTLDPALLRELDRIVMAARKELLAS